MASSEIFLVHFNLSQIGNWLQARISGEASELYFFYFAREKKTTQHLTCCTFFFGAPLIFFVDTADKYKNLL